MTQALATKMSSMPRGTQGHLPVSISKQEASASAANSPVQEHIYVVVGIHYEPRRGWMYDAQPGRTCIRLNDKTCTASLLNCKKNSSHSHAEQAAKAPRLVASMFQEPGQRTAEHRILKATSGPAV